MTNTRTVPTVPAPLSPDRPRLRAVDRDEAADRDEPVGLVDAAGFLPPGATWLPAPPHTLPVLPGRPPMVGYLVLVPAGRRPVPAGVLPTGRHPADPYQGAVPEPAAGAPAAGPVRIDSSRRIAAVDGVALDLTYLEFELLAHLVANPHRVHTRDQLVTTVWGYGHVGDGRTVDVHVARLRRKLGAEHRRSIQTVRRVGYKYAP